MKVWKSNRVKSAAAAALLAMAGSAWADNASAQTEQQATPEQVSQYICNLAATGVADLAAMHQSDKSLGESQQHLNAMVAELQPNYGLDAEMSELIQQYWAGVLESYYIQAPEKTQERKQAVVASVYQTSYQSCIQGAMNAADAAAK